jgi:hypothetical protein
MNRYLNDHLNQAHRSDLVDEAATNRLASAPTLPERVSGRGLRAAIRRIVAAPEANLAGFLPRLVDYPSARH